jgi:hypothetical protein
MLTKRIIRMTFPLDFGIIDIYFSVTLRKKTRRRR